MTTPHLTSLIVTSELRTPRALGNVRTTSAGAFRDRMATREHAPAFSLPVVRVLPLRAARFLTR